MRRWAPFSSASSSCAEARPDASPARCRVHLRSRSARRHGNPVRGNRVRRRAGAAGRRITAVAGAKRRVRAAFERILSILEPVPTASGSRLSAWSNAGSWIVGERRRAGRQPAGRGFSPVTEMPAGANLPPSRWVLGALDPPGSMSVDRRPFRCATGCVTGCAKPAADAPGRPAVVAVTRRKTPLRRCRRPRPPAGCR